MDSPSEGSAASSSTPTDSRSSTSRPPSLDAMSTWESAEPGGSVPLRSSPVRQPRWQGRARRLLFRLHNRTCWTPVVVKPRTALSAELCHRVISKMRELPWWDSELKVVIFSDNSPVRQELQDEIGEDVTRITSADRLVQPRGRRGIVPGRREDLHRDEVSPPWIHLRRVRRRHRRPRPTRGPALPGHRRWTQCLRGSAEPGESVPLRSSPVR